MSKELNMIGSTKEDLEMMEIINANQRKVREDNIKKSKLAKREAWMIKAIMFLIGVGITLGTLFIMYLVAWIESLTF